MKMTIAAWLIGIVCLGAALPGCLAINTGRAPTYASTMGQELIDLKRAKDDGAITQEEYNKLKSQLQRSRANSCK